MNNLVQTNEERDAVVAAYKEAGLGGERYGVVCGLVDPETGQRCMKRICPQGWAAAMKFNAELNTEGKVSKAGLYCLHRENYDGTEPADDIASILNAHGLPWRPLRTLRKMRENKPNKKKGKNNAKGQGSQKRTGNDAQAGRGDNASGSVRDTSGHGEASGEVPDSPTFAQYLDGKVDVTGGSFVAPSDGESGRARLFLARREKEAEERRTLQRSPSEDSD